MSAGKRPGGRVVMSMRVYVGAWDCFVSVHKIDFVDEQIFANNDRTLFL